MAFFVFQPNICITLFDILSCKSFEPEPNKSFIRKDLRIECYTKDYYLWIFFMALPSLLLYGIFYPFFQWKYTKENRNNCKKIGFLFFQFEKKKIYW